MLRNGPRGGKDVNLLIFEIRLILGGWDVSGMPSDKAMHRAEVLDWYLQRQVIPLIHTMSSSPISTTLLHRREPRASSG